MMSHAAIVCREYGLPAVVGTGRATAEIQYGPADPGRRLQRRGHAARRRGSRATVSRDVARSLAGAAGDRRGRLRRQEQRAGRADRAAGSRSRPALRSRRDAFEAFLRSTGSAAHRREASRMTPGISPRSRPRCARSREACARRRSRTAIAAEVERHYARAGSAPPAAASRAVAVRSRARGEDCADATFAGQQETYLWVRGADGVCDAIRAAGSASTARRRSATGPISGPPTRPPRWASPCSDGRRRGRRRDVHVQPADRRPERGRDQRELGLGLGVVGGEVTPDDFLICKVTGELCASTIEPTSTSSTCLDPGGRGTRPWRSRFRPRRTAPCLDDERLATVLVDAGRVERHFGSRQDVEWAIARTGSFRRQFFVAPVATGHGDGAARSEAVADRAGLDAMSLVLGTFGVGATEGLSLALSDEDVSEILRIIDSIPLDELEIETPSFSLHVTRGGARARPAPPPRSRRRLATPRGAPRRRAPRADGVRGEAPTIEAPMLGTFYRTESPAHPPFVEARRPRRARHGRLPDRGDEADELTSRPAWPGRSSRSWPQSGELVEFGAAASSVSRSSANRGPPGSSSPTAARSRCGSCARAASWGSRASWGLERGPRLARRRACRPRGGARRPHASESYLRVGTIIEAARGTGCDAIHPGYGFLAESPALAAAAAEHGLRFVGPPAAVIATAGDKLAAREVATRAGLPVVPGREVATLKEAEQFAAEHRLPAAAEGGRRRRRARHQARRRPRAAETQPALARAEAGAAFGDERLYVERLIVAARHSRYRSPPRPRRGDPPRRARLLDAAPLPEAGRGGPGVQARPRAARAAAGRRGSRSPPRSATATSAPSSSSSTPTASFHFLECNCRIQVEHPVTEAVCGLDLVALQLAIADGEALPLAQDEVTFDGHAIECRLVAEDPARDFAPSPGA